MHEYMYLCMCMCVHTQVFIKYRTLRIKELILWNIIIHVAALNTEKTVFTMKLQTSQQGSISWISFERLWMYWIQRTQVSHFSQLPKFLMIYEIIHIMEGISQDEKK